VRLAGDAPDAEQAVTAILQAHAAAYALLKRRTIQPGKEKAEQRLAYRVMLKDSAAERPLMQALAALPGVSEAAMSLDSASTQNSGGGDDD